MWEWLLLALVAVTFVYAAWTLWLTQKERALFNAFASGDEEELERRLLRDERLIRRADTLVAAVQWNRLGTAQWLLDRGADANARTRFGVVPLHVARSIECVEFLTARGADVNARNHCGQQPLHSAALAGDVRLALALLRHGAELNSPDTLWKMTPLDIAASCGHVEIVSALLLVGAKLSALTPAGKIKPLKGAYARPEQFAEVENLLRATIPAQAA